ncbi:glycoside hydrolase family 133 protein [Aplosporella prunicola CBS 121167]|uniref:Glycogen debranching enzyme n=1 Tax=Aplosporella prunicola CBS 121167 TaxID=1176127 RepID=A0A6A6BE02_9PEZI|nr:glycoside hydrolase family 133 protein [Aplosporella prunicola CBS 121167]KAF2141738.1 glycoside hydrolase family 133 protein [Aplosporella prunicola CBS 121167]
MAPPQTVYLLPLTDGGAPDVPGTYIYLPAPTDPAYIVRFAIEGTSSICREGSLWVNIPAKGETFQRDNFREYKLRPDFNGTIEIDCPIHYAGAFAYYCTFTPLPNFSTSDSAASQPARTPTYYIDVEPNLKLQDTRIPLDSLSIFSVISKFMGEYPKNWDNHLRGISQRGYNMVHFTPLMMRGDSNSPYSLYDQHQFDQALFPRGEQDIADLVHKMEKEFNLFSLTDVVWNHTANNSKWLEEHPEAGYNLETAPWLESALALDDALLKLSNDLQELGLPTTLHNTDELTKIMDAVKTKVIAGIRLWEYYVLDCERDATDIVKAWKEGEVTFPDDGFGKRGVSGLQEVQGWPLKQKADWLLKYALLGNDRLGERFRRRVDPMTAAALLSALFGRYDSRTNDTGDERAAYGTIYKFVQELNLQFYREYDAEVAVIMDQLYNRIKYVRLDDHGPKLGPITKDVPLIESYFTRLPDNATTKQHSKRSLALANNGWIWAADAMKDNAGSQSRAYLRREVIVWGDCVKLRYGSGPQDNPFLWDFMAKYTRLMAKYFAGFRIDNCHSTPIHLAEYMLDEARKIRPNLVIGAELFTGSEEMDFVFCKRLGISFLIREAMQAWSTQELSRLVHRHAGIPIGSFELDEVMNADISADQPHEVVRVIRKSPVHALFMDCTHDNEVPAQKRDARDTLPNAALVAMCACATGSVMGYDEIYPKLIELVHETRLYESPYSSGSELKVQASEGGIGGIKKLLNQIHTLMGQENYDETFIHHDNEYITVHRVHPHTRKGYFLIAHTAFPGYGDGNGGFPPVHLPGTQAKLMGSWMLDVEDSAEVKARTEKDKKKLKGLPSRTKDIQGMKVEASGDNTTITVPDIFPPGSIALFETWIPSCERSDGLDKFVTTGAREAFKDCNLVDLNMVLYRCDPEERDSSQGKDGVYAIPGHGSLVYAGLQGWWSVLRDVVHDNNLGHPICNHLRDGQWALDYCVGRLERMANDSGYENLRGPAAWLKERFDAIRQIPNFLLPRYFAMVIQTAYNAAVDQAIQLLNENVRGGQKFLKSLALVSIQMTGYMSNASLWPVKSVPSMAAGLPHFSNDWARCWGRDIFISLRGLYLGTGRYKDAKEHILAFASVVKHGMIPNLLGSGKLPRYNSRDSVWFFLQNIQDYTKIVPEGLGLLAESTKRRFLPYDDEWFPHDDSRSFSKSSTIEDVIQECLQRHASGMSFREYNAGPNLDSQMKWEGFQIDIHPDWNNGLIFGGNQFNCGTWMDKMGESEKAGSKGVPGTPRDGAAIEITGMLYSTLKWVDELNKAGKYKYDGVDIEGGQHLTFAEWAAKIKDNFERVYYVPQNAEEDKNYDVNSAIVNRRGIYKDLYRSGKEYEDYQLRPNFTIAMTVAPDLFDPEKALNALYLADTALRGPTGMATLDPSDLNYRPNYNNAEDSTDFHTSKGRNYHQGPEWLWPTGFFLRALLRFDLTRRKTPEERVESYQQVTRRLHGCMEAIKSSPWAGLTELTNQAGSFCGDSSPTQAWSAGCLIDLYQDAKEFSAEHPVAA